MIFETSATLHPISISLIASLMKEIHTQHLIHPYNIVASHTSTRIQLQVLSNGNQPDDNHVINSMDTTTPHYKDIEFARREQ